MSDAARYDGSFRLDWLRPGEFVRASGSSLVGGCEIATEAGAVLCQLVPGDVLMRTPDGRPYAVKVIETQALVTVELTLDCYPDGDAEWAELSREIAAKMFEIDNVIGADVEIEDRP